ncbi:hypothetical protein LPJ64_001655 [Coemansia asiatica]|uniref:Uncharacterized protein n=1 Tax=Coemansia asiatica TaxID=1052880 RepID=A0A9W8CL98_9FUNG|nr:hypothetical protein LPJ64_001655 [Coemansia asiatica]
MLLLRNSTARRGLGKSVSAVVLAGTNIACPGTWKTTTIAKAFIRQTRSLATKPPPLETEIQINRKQLAANPLKNKSDQRKTANGPGSPNQALRAQALLALETSISIGDIISAYRIASVMRTEKLLQSDSTGNATPYVIRDIQVTKMLCRAVRKHPVWEECLPLLNLVVGLRRDYLGKGPTNWRFISAGLAVERGVNSEAVIEVIDAILSPQFASLPDRRLAGLTAKQVLLDYAKVIQNTDTRRLRIRAEGFASRGRSLNKLISGLDLKSLRMEERFELALAYARCLEIEEAKAMVSQCIGSLGADQIREARSALALCFAESGFLDEAMEQVAEIKDSCSMSDLFCLRLWIIYSSALAVAPRMPFSENFHTLASAHRSKPFKADFAQKIAHMLDEIHEELDILTNKEQVMMQSGIAQLLFACDCTVSAINGTERKGATGHKWITGLSEPLHSLQIAAVQRMAAANIVFGSALATAISQSSCLRPLRLYFWTLLFDKQMSTSAKKIAILQELQNAKKTIPGFKISASEIEPALLLALPADIWSQALRGNFSDDSAFAPSDEFLASITRIPQDSYVRAMIDLATSEMFAAGSGHRLYPLCIWLFSALGKTKEALELARRSLEKSTGLVPEAVALRVTRDSSFYEKLFLALSTFNEGAKFAVTHVVPAMDMQLSPVDAAASSRLACAILRCCATSSNAHVAHDTFSQLVEKGTQAMSPKVLELYMRACFRGGHTTKALALFRDLNYGSRRSMISEPSFAMILALMGDSKGSAPGSEHIFDAWFQMMNHRGLIGPALITQYSTAGLSRDARSVRNAFMPASQSIASVLESLGLKKQQPSAFASRGYLRAWEFHMVALLISAYVRTGLSERARVWELWLIQAMEQRRVYPNPEFLARISYLQRRHLMRKTPEDLCACLDLVIAADKMTSQSLFKNKAFFVNQKRVLAFLSKLIKHEDSGPFICQHLSNRQADHLIEVLRNLD